MHALSTAQGTVADGNLGAHGGLERREVEGTVIEGQALEL